MKHKSTAMKKFFLPILIIASFISCSHTQTQNTNTAQAAPAQGIVLLKPQEFNNMMQNKPGILLDVRTPGEYKKGFIKGARLLDIFSDEFDTELAKLDKTKTYYVYCASGGRSDECAQKMLAMGFTNIYDLDGGFSQWKNFSLPFEMPK